MRLAVLADAIGKGLDAPIFHLCDVATHLLDDALVTGRQFIDLLLRQILPRQIDVLVQCHANASPWLRRSGAKPLVPFGKGSKAQEGGNTGRRTIRSCLCHFRPHWPSFRPMIRDNGRPFSSRPGSSGSWRYRGFGPECNPKGKQRRWCKTMAQVRRAYVAA